MDEAQDKDMDDVIDKAQGTESVCVEGIDLDSLMTANSLSSSSASASPSGRSSSSAKSSWPFSNSVPMAGVWLKWWIPRLSNALVRRRGAVSLDEEDEALLEAALSFRMPSLDDCCWCFVRVWVCEDCRYAGDGTILTVTGVWLLLVLSLPACSALVGVLSNAIKCKARVISCGFVVRSLKVQDSPTKDIDGRED